MLVSAVSLHGVIPAVKNSPKSNSNYASTAQTHDTFQKSGVNFGTTLAEVLANSALLEEKARRFLRADQDMRRSIPDWGGVKTLAEAKRAVIEHYRNKEAKAASNAVESSEDVGPPSWHSRWNDTPDFP